MFDPSVMSYRDLLEFFFQVHDPTTKNRQGYDVGMSYRSAIYYTSEEQRRLRRRRSPTSTRRACGRARSSPRWNQRARSGRPSQSTRTTCSTTRTGTRATSSGRTGSSPAGRRVVASPGGSSPWLPRLGSGILHVPVAKRVGASRPGVRPAGATCRGEEHARLRHRPHQVSRKEIVNHLAACKGPDLVSTEIRAASGRCA